MDDWGNMDPEEWRMIWVAIGVIVVVVALALYFGGPEAFNP